MIKNSVTNERTLKLREWRNRPKDPDKPKGEFFTTYTVSISPNLVKELGWKKDEELKASIKNDKLVIEKE